jgi:hypothetical protein
MSLLLVAIFIVSICPTTVLADSNDITISLRATSDLAGTQLITKAAPNSSFYLWVDYSNNPTILDDSLCAYNIFIGYNSSIYTIGSTSDRDCKSTVNTETYGDGIIALFGVQRMEYFMKKKILKGIL